MAGLFVHNFISGRRGIGRTLLLLHGTGGDETSLLGLAGIIAPDFSVLAVRGKVREGESNRFFKRFPDGSFDLEDLLFRTGELADFVENARKDYDLGKVYAIGYSNGANIAASMLFLRPKTLEGAVLFRPQVPLEPKELPDLRGKRIFISSGKSDGMVGPGQPEKLREMFGRAGAEVTLNYENAGHGLAKGEIARAGKWMAKAGPG